MLRTRHKDERYEDIMEKYENRDKGVAFNFLLQGMLVCLTSIPLYYVFKNPLISTGTFNSTKAIFSIAMISLGILGETVADAQLQKFKEDKKKGITRAPFYREGLWRHSRHPNLFFDLMIWSGFSLYGKVKITRLQSDGRCLDFTRTSFTLVLDEICDHSYHRARNDQKERCTSNGRVQISNQQFLTNSILVK